MRLFLFGKSSSSAARAVDRGVERDAEELIQLWGADACERADSLSWREDSGLVSSSRPGHWWRVRREIGRRCGQDMPEPQAEFAA